MWTNPSSSQSHEFRTKSTGHKRWNWKILHTVIAQRHPWKIPDKDGELEYSAVLPSPKKSNICYVCKRIKNKNQWGLHVIYSFIFNVFCCAGINSALFSFSLLSRLSPWLRWTGLAPSWQSHRLPCFAADSSCTWTYRPGSGSQILRAVRAALKSPMNSCLTVRR